MPAISFEGRSYPVAAEQSALDALLAGGVEAAHSCKAGTCGSCMMRAVEGALPEKAQAGLKASWKAQGYFLPCLCLPDADLSVAKVGSDARWGAAITALERLSSDVLGVRLTCDTVIDFRAGQYITLLLGGVLARSYSIASLPGGLDIEIHVRRIAGGKMSGWLHDTAKVSDRVQIQGLRAIVFICRGTRTNRSSLPARELGSRHFTEFCLTLCGRAIRVRSRFFTVRWTRAVCICGTNFGILRPATQIWNTHLAFCGKPMARWLAGRSSRWYCGACRN